MRMIFTLVGVSAALCGAAAPVAASGASGARSAIKSITLARHVIDRRHTAAWRNWTIGFARGRPFAEYSDEGTTLRGLRCASTTSASFDCRLFMAMQPLESFAHFCEIAPDSRQKSGRWPLRIDCPTQIDFYRSATSIPPQ